MMNDANHTQHVSHMVSKPGDVPVTKVYSHSGPGSQCPNCMTDTRDVQGTEVSENIDAPKPDVPKDTTTPKSDGSKKAGLWNDIEKDIEKLP
jgi:hypothetical protein